MAPQEKTPSNKFMNDSVSREWGLASIRIPGYLKGMDSLLKWRKYSTKSKKHVPTLTPMSWLLEKLTLVISELKKSKNRINSPNILN